MKSLHVKSPCCGGKIYRFGSRRRQCSHCKRTWRVRRKKRGRPRWRVAPGLLEEVLLQGRSLKNLSQRLGLSPQALSYRFGQALRRFVGPSRLLRLPGGPLILLIDGLYFRFNTRPWVLYLMAVKPCHQNRAVFLDPVLFAGREQVGCWSEAFTTIPTPVKKRIRALVCDQIRGILSLAAREGWALQFCHFHLISQLQGTRRRTRSTSAGPDVRTTLYRLSRQALELPDGPRFQTLLKRLQRLTQHPSVPRRMRMVAREFLRRRDQFRAYRKHPQLNLPTTTGTVEAMGRIVGDLMRRTRSLSSPQALWLWTTALIRLRPEVMCNGKHFQPN